MKNLTKISSLVVLIFYVVMVFASDHINDESKYMVMVDAGSTGSRLHIFQYDTGSNGIPDIKDITPDDPALKIKPGISSYAKDPADAGPPVVKMAQESAKVIAKQGGDVSKTPLYVYATAGMRLLPKESQDKVEDSIQGALTRETDFRISKGAVTTIPGTMEAMFDWLTVNYLKHNFRDDKPTEAAMDLGGASTQIAAATKLQAPSQDIKNVNLAGKNYRVYVHSYLNLGQVRAHDLVNPQAAPIAACYPNGYPLGNGEVGAFNQAVCKAAIDNNLSKYVDEKVPATLLKGKTVDAFSGYFYAMSFFKGDTASQLSSNVDNYCNKTDWTQMQKDHPELLNYDLQNYCFNGTYVADLLDGRDFYAFNADQKVNPLDKIAGVDMDWPIGAVLYNVVTQ